MHKRSTWGVLTPLGWSLSGPLVQKEEYNWKARSCYCSIEEQSAQKFKCWSSVESYGSMKKVEFLSSVEKKAQPILEFTTKVGCREVELLWSEDQSKLPNNYESVTKEAFKDDEPKTNNQETIKTDLKKGIIEKLSQNGISNTENARIWYLFHHLVFHSLKPGKFRDFVMQLRSIKGYLWIIIYYLDQICCRSM